MELMYWFGEEPALAKTCLEFITVFNEVDKKYIYILKISVVIVTHKCTKKVKQDTQ